MIIKYQKIGREQWPDLVEWLANFFRENNKNDKRMRLSLRKVIEIMKLAVAGGEFLAKPKKMRSFPGRFGRNVFIFIKILKAIVKLKKQKGYQKVRGPLGLSGIGDQRDLVEFITKIIKELDKGLKEKRPVIKEATENFLNELFTVMDEEIRFSQP